MCFSQFSSVQSLSCVQLFATPWITARQASLSITNSWSLLKLMFIELVMPFNHLILCCLLLLPLSIFSSIRVFSNGSVLRIRWPKYWSFSISPSNEYSGLISFRIDWLDLLSVEGTIKSLLQHHSSKASILQCSAFFILLLERKKVNESEVSQSCPTLCNPMDYSTPGFPVHHQLPELAQTHVHRVSDAIQSFCHLSSPSPLAFILS